MYMDRENLFSNEQDLAAGVSENIIDFGSRGDAYEALFLAVSLNGAIPEGQELKVDVETSDNEDFSTAEILASFTSKKGDINIIAERFPRMAKRYARLKYAPSEGLASLKVTAFLTPDVPTR